MSHPTDDTDGVTLPAAELSSGLSRREVLGLVGAGAAGAVVGAGAAAMAGAALGGGAAQSPDLSYPFYGAHQAGILTPVQDQLHFASFDLTRTANRGAVIELLREWTDAAARLTRGRDVTQAGAVGGPPLAPPDDTGDALDLGPSGLTITFGFGPTLFHDAQGTDRLGIGGRRPAEFEELPLFAFDLIDRASSGGDLCIQACANDPQVAVHAIRNLSRIAFGTARIRWTQLGFGRTSSTTTGQLTPRNLFGFKDGTANIMSENRDAVLEHVWVPETHPQAWLRGGSYLVGRKIQMLIESWDRVSLHEQEHIIGRSKGEGAPLSGGREATTPDFERVSADGEVAIPVDAHVRLAHPVSNAGARMLRRGYNYVNGNNDLGQLDAGLFFLAYQAEPETFITVQRSLARDTLNEYIRHVGSSIWAVPPGAREGEFVGQALFSE
ncbi:MAG: deferrochelatase/peroxidase EfeB [Cryobacterium sp.]|nr:deferrochelatase/peroxidase EfeB [Cryobacterium sp.]